MDEPKQKFTTVDEYIEASTYDVEPRLIETRRVIRAALPDADETISYNIPAYKQDGVVVVQFGGFTHHTSLTFYPMAGALTKFGDQLTGYRISKSAIRFPLDQPLPVDLIDAIARFRGHEAAEFAASKKAGK